MVEHGLVNVNSSGREASYDSLFSSDPILRSTGCHARPQFPPQSLNPPQSSPETAQPGEPRFLVQVANACRVRHLAYSTEQSYVSWVKRFILFHNKRHPATWGREKFKRIITCQLGTKPEPVLPELMSIFRTCRSEDQFDSIRSIQYPGRRLVC